MVNSVGFNVLAFLLVSVVYVFCLFEAICAAKTLTDKIEYNEFSLKTLANKFKTMRFQTMGRIHFFSRVILFKRGFSSEMILKILFSRKIQFMPIREIFQILHCQINTD